MLIRSYTKHIQFIQQVSLDHPVHDGDCSREVEGRTAVPKDVPILIPGTHKYVMLHGKGALRLLMELRVLTADLERGRLSYSVQQHHQGLHK